MVGTPGRIIDLIDQDALDLSRVSEPGRERESGKRRKEDAEAGRGGARRGGAGQGGAGARRAGGLAVMEGQQAGRLPRRAHELSAHAQRSMPNIALSGRSGGATASD